MIETKLSDVQGEAGKLVIAGYDVETIAKQKSFEETLGLLWGAVGVNVGDLGAARLKAWKRLRPSAQQDGMASLREQVAALDDDDPTAILGAVAVFAARTNVEPNPKLSHAADTYRLLTGSEDPIKARAFERYMITVVDHGMNASTYTARVIASTESDTVSAITGAIGALKGPLHGGAPGPVLDMLDAIGTEENALPWLEKEVTAGRRIMGMGHRIYRTRDPRAAVLEDALHTLPSQGRLPLARAVEKTARGFLKQRYPERGLDTNVEFYTAVLLDALGIDRRFFSSIFALARAGGWLAHIAEQRLERRLIRPDSKYVGPVL